MSQYTDALLDVTNLSEIAESRIALVYTEWNDRIVAEQVAGAERMADRLGVVISHRIAVPGCVELPFACQQIAKKPMLEVDAIITFGAVIRGATPHFEYVCKMLTEGLGQLNLSQDIPVIFGVLTVNTEDQIWERLGGSHGHKGEEAMISAAKMIAVNKEIKSI